MSRIHWGLLGACLILLLWWRHLSSNDDEKYLKAMLDKLLVPRWVGSEGHDIVLEFLVEELSRQKFTVIRDEFFDVFSEVNVVGILNPQAKQFLLLSCHYDSKFLDTTDNYVAATDAAVSCAILLNMADKLYDFLHNEFASQNDVGLVLAFFDGHDSLDGIQDNYNPLLGSKSFVKAETISLNKISLAISLNLIGAPDQIYMSKYQHTYEFHERLADIEQELRVSGDLSECHQLFHKLKDHYNDIEDDHFPFLEKGLPVMHIVPYTYPEVWLQEADNLQNLHWPTVRNMDTIITQFVYEYLFHRTMRID